MPNSWVTDLISINKLNTKTNVQQWIVVYHIPMRLVKFVFMIRETEENPSHSWRDSLLFLWENIETIEVWPTQPPSRVGARI